MYRSTVILVTLILLFLNGWAQTVARSNTPDSTLKEVVVSAFNTGLRWKDAPAAIAIISQKDINQHSPVSLVPVFNAVPGIRMEERSPGSYRLSVRGSLLRSPFGVRNVKVYWNQIPLSDATGNTYLNLTDLQQANQIEVAKGPAASSYGAGTGGVVFLNHSMPAADSAINKYSLQLTAGSFGLNRQQMEWNFRSPDFSSLFQMSRTQSDGYREQSALLKSGITWQTVARFKDQELNTLFFYTDLYYGTPGGITAAQMQSDPRLSRQPAGPFPGALQQKAAVYNKTLFGALKHRYQLSPQTQLNGFISLSHTGFSNPFITNFEKRKELNMNMGLQVAWSPKQFLRKMQWINGAEWLFNESGILNYNNQNGVAGALQSEDMVYSRQGFLFSQIRLPISEQLLITAGFSINQQLYEYKRSTDVPAVFSNRQIAAPFVPRFALTYQLNADLSLYAIVAEGFSAPGLSEVRPSDGNFYPFLNAERGWNLEAGLKGFLLNDQITFDLSYYRFKLNDAIVRRNNSSGADYFVNAGSTLQQGVEFSVKYTLVEKADQFFRSLVLYNSISIQPYRFLTYTQGAIDYSGKKLTGVPQNIFVAGASLTAAGGWYFNTSLNAVSAIPLNDANTVSADAYRLLQAKLGRVFVCSGHTIDLFAGGDNLLNQLYSLGNDINAAGNRYFNPAPARNWYAGIRLALQ